MSKSEKRAMWEDRLAAYQSSGQKASEWCAAQQISPRQFWYWKQRLKEEETQTSAEGQWVALHVGEELQESEPGPALFVRVGEAVIEVRPGFDSRLLSDVVKVLQALC